MVSFWTSVPCTIPFKIKHPVYNICMYWTNIWQPTVHVQQNIFEEAVIKNCSPHIYASFGTFESKLGNYSRHSESLNLQHINRFLENEGPSKIRLLQCYHCYAVLWIDVIDAICRYELVWIHKCIVVFQNTN